MKVFILLRFRGRPGAWSLRAGGCTAALANALTWMMLLGLCVGASVASAQDVIQLDATTKPAIEQKSAIERPRPQSIQRGFVPMQTDVRLMALDLAELLREDKELLDQRRVRRVGIRRSLPSPIILRQGDASHGAWTDLGDAGRVWTVTLESEGSWATRLFLEDVQLPPDSRLWAYATDDPDQVVGPVPARFFRTESDHWTASVFASRVTLELELPPSADQDSIDLRLSEIAHGHVPLDELVPESHKVDTCYNDASCDAVWHFEQNGVALIHIVTPVGTLQCSGCLMADFDDQTWEDYFLTANHCLSGNSAILGLQTAASSMEFYWFFQTPHCDGSPPLLSTVPRTTGGADLIHTETGPTGNDAAFVRARAEAPGGTVVMGWTTGSPPLGEDTAGIHHPDGTFSRISYGNLSSSTASYWLNVWNSGSTEDGSSGSPLMDSNRRVIGTLSGGLASCTNMSAPDYYGRWNVTYPNVRRWIEIGGTLNVDSSHSGIEEGTPDRPFDTVGEAYAFAWDGTRIRIQGGSYSEAVTFTKDLTLLGANGSVTIGN